MAFPVEGGFAADWWVSIWQYAGLAGAGVGAGGERG